MGKENLPLPIFLHGNTGISVCQTHEPIIVGVHGETCSHCGAMYEKSPLLYPITKKDYTNDLFIQKGWSVLKRVLSKAYIFTIFGYSAPLSDVAAINLLQEGWGRSHDRNLAEIEIIDIVGSERLVNKWDSFIHSHHRRTMKSFYDSLIYKYCRRSCDAFWDSQMDLNPREENSILIGASWDELDKWLKPYIEVENNARQH